MIGGGNTAVEEALYLSDIAKKVTVIHRRDKFRAEPILIDRLLAKEKEGIVEIKWNHMLDEVTGDDRRHRPADQDTRETGTTSDIALQGLFVAIGHKPNTDIFAGQLEMQNGYIITNGGLRALRRPPACRACSRPATCRTTCIARRSPAPARAVWPRWTRSAISKPSTRRPASMR